MLLSGKLKILKRCTVAKSKKKVGMSKMAKRIIIFSLLCFVAAFMPVSAAVEGSIKNDRNKQSVNEVRIELISGDNKGDFWLMNKGESPVTVVSVTVVSTTTGGYTIRPERILNSQDALKLDQIVFGLDYYNWLGITGWRDATISVETDFGTFVGRMADNILSPKKVR